MKQTHSNKLLFIGLATLIIGIVDFTYTLFFESPYELLWFSNNITILLGLALIFRNRFFMGAMLITTAVEVPWIIDFFSRLIFRAGVFGNATEYMFKDFGFRSINFYMELDHIIVVPIALYGAYKIGVHKKSYLISSSHAILLNILTFFFAPPSKNINCIYYLCSLKEDIFKINDMAYFVVWTALLCITAYLLNKVVIKCFKHK